MKTPEVGVLSLQGASEPHRAVFARLGVAAREVRSRRDLEGLTHLVLPGGESTTLQHLLTLFDLWEPIAARQRAGELALFGTCAGAILLSRGSGATPPTPPTPPTMGLLDAEVRRNAYGRQIDSSVREAKLTAPDERLFRAVFIRAPRFVALGPSVSILAREGDEPIAVAAPGLLATTFHPELADEPYFHQRFLSDETWSTAGSEQTELPGSDITSLSRR